MPPPLNDDVAALQYAALCWKRRLRGSPPVEIEEIDTLLAFVPLAPESMRPLLVDRAWTILASMVQRSDATGGALLL